MKYILDQGVKCLIIQCKFSAFSFWNYVDVCKLVDAKYPAAPLGLITVAGLLPQQWEFRLIDENVEELLDEHFEWADVVCTGGMLPQQKNILKVIERAHQHNCLVMVGGPDPTSQPQIYQSADFLVCNEGEMTIPLLINDLEKGVRSGHYVSAEMADMSQAVIPRFDLINFKNYIQVGIQYSRGCPFNCEFCDIIELYGRKPRTKKTDHILKELDTLYKLGYRGHVDFVDDNFIGNKLNVKKVLPAIKEWSAQHKYPFYFTTEASINIADDEVLMKMMKDVDFRYVFIGIESSEEELLKSMQKKQNVNKPLKETIEKIYKYGMVVNAGYIMGFDNESPRTAEIMIHSIQNSGVCMAMIGTLYALPNTQLTRRLLKEKRLFDNSSNPCDDDIDQLTSGLNFITTRPRTNILSDYMEVLKNVYSPESYYERVLYTGLKLDPPNYYKPGLKKVFMMVKSLFRVFVKCGFNKTTGKLFWKTFFITLFKNPKAAEAVVNLSAMYLHFGKQSDYIINITHEKLEHLSQMTESQYNEKMFISKEDKIRVNSL